MSAQAETSTKSMKAPSWSPSKIEQWKIERLRHADRNARKHSAKQLEQLRSSLRDFGFPKPILARHDGRIVAGHGRWEAAKLEGFKIVPVIVCPRGWSDEQCRAFSLVDNKLGDNSEWDDEVLDQELADLSELGLDLAPFGFGDDNLGSPGGDGEEPDGAEQTIESAYQVLIECADEAEQLTILARLQEDGIKARALIA